MVVAARNKAPRLGGLRPGVEEVRREHQDGAATVWERQVDPGCFPDTFSVFVSVPGEVADVSCAAALAGHVGLPPDACREEVRDEVRRTFCACSERRVSASARAARGNAPEIHLSSAGDASEDEDQVEAGPGRRSARLLSSDLLHYGPALGEVVARRSGLGRDLFRLHTVRVADLPAWSRWFLSWDDRAYWRRFAVPHGPSAPGNGSEGDRGRAVPAPPPAGGLGGLAVRQAADGSPGSVPVGAGHGFGERQMCEVCLPRVREQLVAWLFPRPPPWCRRRYTDGGLSWNDGVGFSLDGGSEVKGGPGSGPV